MAADPRSLSIFRWIVGNLGQVANLRVGSVRFGSKEEVTSTFYKFRFLANSGNSNWTTILAQVLATT